MQSRSDLHHKQIFLTLLILFSGITRQPLLFKVAYENTGRCINSFYEHKDFIIVQLHLYFCIYWYLLILKINLLPYYYKSTFYVHMIQSNYWRSIHCSKYKKLVVILFIQIQCIRDKSEKIFVNVKK